nr:MAG TPA: hypothetical protein [Caudoviricetes sp.]
MHSSQYSSPGITGLLHCMHNLTSSLSINFTSVTRKFVSLVSILFLEFIELINVCVQKIGISIKKFL